MQHIRQLQKAADSHHQEIATVNQCTQTILNELKTLSKLADTAASSAQFGTERMHTVAKMASLLDRMQALQQVCLFVMLSPYSSHLLGLSIAALGRSAPGPASWVF